MASSTTIVTTSVRFISQTLENMYAGGSEAGGSFSLTTLGTELASFRGDTSGQTQNQALATIDATIQTFETAYVPNTAASGTTAQNYPVDQQGLTQQLMSQVYAQLLQAGTGKTYGSSTENPIDPTTGFLNTTSGTNFAAIPGGNFSQLDFNPNDSQTVNTSAYYYLNSTGQQILTTYYNLIQGAFAEGLTTANNPVDPGTTQTVLTAAVTAIPQQVIGGVTYGYVTYLTIPPATTPQSYLVSDNISLQAVAKQALTNSQYSPDGSAASQVGYQVTFVDQTAPGNATLLPVDANYQPNGASITTPDIRFMDAITYTYYWNEARVAVMKGKLNYQQDVVQILQNALSAANNASTDLTQQSGLTEQQDSSQKPDPNASPETVALNMFVAIVSTPSSPLFAANFANPSTGSPSTSPHAYNFNYSEWQANQVALKNYTDNLNAQAQNAMLDYQQTLNNYNNGYQVMGQIQDKYNTMFQSQLQNFLSTTG